MGLTEQHIDDGCLAYEDAAKGFGAVEKCALRYVDLMFPMPTKSTRRSTTK